MHRSICLRANKVLALGKYFGFELFFPQSSSHLHCPPTAEPETEAATTGLTDTTAATVGVLLQLDAVRDFFLVPMLSPPLPPKKAITGTTLVGDVRDAGDVVEATREDAEDLLALAPPTRTQTTRYLRVHVFDLYSEEHTPMHKHTRLVLKRHIWRPGTWRPKRTAQQRTH